MVLKKIGKEWFLLSRKTGKVLRRFGKKKPSHKQYLKIERQIQFFKLKKTHPKRYKKILKTFKRRRPLKRRRIRKSSWRQTIKVRI